MAESKRDFIEQLVMRPGESLVVEIKTWISPKEPAGQAKIVKAALALRNRGGGNLVIGIDDKTLQQDRVNFPEDIQGAYHVDIIQALIAKFSSEVFEVGVEFVAREDLVHPVISIPVGVRTPVAAKADLKDGDTFLIRTDDVYFRTLNSGNVVSTSRVKWKDWRDLLDTCFENREADIGRFLRRHLSGADPAAILSALADTSHSHYAAAITPTKVMDEGHARFHAAVQQRQLVLPSHGSWEVALVIDGDAPAQTDLNAFARLLSASNPGYTGWPMWLDGRGLNRAESRPYVLDGAWETIIVSTESSTFKHVDFMRQDPKGRFYSYRALDDDMSRSAPEPETALDAILPVLRVWEAIAVGLAFAKALQAGNEARLHFKFRWNGLANRLLTSWVDPMRYVTPRTARQNTVTSTVSVPLETPITAISAYVKAAVQPLYEVFDGFVLSDGVVDEVTRKLQDRRL